MNELLNIQKSKSLQENVTHITKDSYFLYIYDFLSLTIKNRLHKMSQ